jgi:hypothetical protein
MSAELPNGATVVDLETNGVQEAKAEPQSQPQPQPQPHFQPISQPQPEPVQPKPEAPQQTAFSWL